MSKPKSKLETQLTEAQQAQLAEWLLNSMPYYRAQELVEKEFGLRVSSLRAFSQFWQKVCEPIILAKRQRAVQTAKAVGDEARQKPGHFSPATIDALEQKAFELAISPGADPDHIKSIFSLLLKAKDQQLEERRIILLEQKASQAEQAEQITKSELTPAEKEQRMRAVFGLS